MGLFEAGIQMHRVRLPRHLSMHAACWFIGWDAGAAGVSVRDVVIPTVEWLERNEFQCREIVRLATFPQWPVSSAAHLHGATSRCCLCCCSSQFAADLLLSGVWFARSIQSHVPSLRAAVG